MRKKRLGAALMFALAGIGTVSADDAHTFTDKDGRTLNATITDVSVTDVSVRRNDGWQFKIPLPTLSEADQDFVSQWAVKQADFHGVFAVSMAESDTASVAGAGFTAVWQRGYKVALYSKAKLDLKNIRVQYVLLLQQEVTASPNRQARLVGVTSLDVLPALATTTFETSKATLRRTVSMHVGHFAAMVNPPPREDRIQAVWIRISDHDGNLLQEWSSDPKITSQLNWDKVFTPPAPPAAARGVSPGAAG